MIELAHSTTVPALDAFRRDNSNATADEFDSLAFKDIKHLVRQHLNQEQGGLCVYCERKLSADAGQVEHIKPKSGPNAYLELAFVYTNFAHSCIDNKTCGQKKKAGLLPIEPGIGCNNHFILLTDGNIVPKEALTRRAKHNVNSTCGMLGLNTASLVNERKQWIVTTIKVLENYPEQRDAFLRQHPFRYILTRL